MPKREEIGTEFPSREWVYRGPVDGKGGVDLADFGQIELDGSLTSRAYLLKNVRKMMTGPLGVGAIYEVRASDDQAYLGTLKFLRLWPDEVERAGWQAVARAREVEKIANRELKTATTKYQLLELLEGVRKAYQSTNYYGKLSLEVIVLHALRTPVDE